MRPRDGVPLSPVFKGDWWPWRTVGSRDPIPRRHHEREERTLWTPFRPDRKRQIAPRLCSSRLAVEAGCSLTVTISVVRTRLREQQLFWLLEGCREEVDQRPRRPSTSRGTAQGVSFTRRPWTGRPASSTSRAQPSHCPVSFTTLSSSTLFPRFSPTGPTVSNVTRLWGRRAS